MEGQWLLILYSIMLIILSIILINAKKKHSGKLWSILFAINFLCCIVAMSLAYYFFQNETNGMFMNGFAEELFSFLGVIVFVIFFIICLVVYKGKGDLWNYQNEKTSD